MLRPVFLLALASAALVARAGTFTFSGSLTSSSPTFNRPEANGNSAPNSLSGLDVFYAQLLFTVDVTGVYTFTTPSDFSLGNSLDAFTLLYQGSLDPVSPLANALIGDDDSAGNFGSYFSYNLTAGTTYGFVVTTFLDEQTGSFNGVISGQGNITPGTSSVPSPAAALPFALMAMRRRRRS